MNVGKWAATFTRLWYLAKGVAPIAHSRRQAARNRLRCAEARSRKSV